ncbi:MAG: hypothetical protein QM687_14910 [Ferruginibacter sp.]
MKNGRARFDFYIDKLDTLLQSASTDHNPALYLYKNDARTPLFMLEALSRLYEKLHNKKKFYKLRAHFKLLEDSLGIIDYYDNYANSFLAHPLIPVYIREYMQAQAREKIQGLNEILYEENWIGPNAKRVKKIRSILKEADWLQSKEEMKAIRDFYEDEIESIKKFTGRYRDGFTEMENQVHEYRRELRWLSIYPQALRGCVQTLDSGLSEDATKEYLLPEIVQSKFNVMPDAGDNKWFLLLEKNYFYALSWMIAELGKIKDEGLQFYAIAEALQQTEGMDHDAALQKAVEITGSEANSIQQLLSRATLICKRYMEQENLDRLVIGLAKTQKSSEE